MNSDCPHRPCAGSEPRSRTAVRYLSARSFHLGWRSRLDTRVAIHSSTSASSQPTVFVVSWRLEGNCPRHSRRQSVVRDSPVRAQTSRHRRKWAGERPTCAGWSDASVRSWLSRALLTSADATRWRLKVATCVDCGEQIRSRYRDRADSLIFCQRVGTNYESTQEVAGRFRRVAVSRKIRGVTGPAHPSAGTGRHGHGDWMVTDRCLIESGDLPIPKLDVAGSTPVARSLRNPVEDKGFLHLPTAACRRAHPGGFRKGSGLAAPSRRSSCRAARRRHGRRRSASRSSRGSCRPGGRRTGASPRRRAAWRCRCGGSGRRGVLPLDAIWSLPPRATNAHRGEALTCSGPRGGGYLRAGRRLLRTQRLDELRDRAADLVGAVLLDEVRPVDRGLGEVGPRPDERADPAALDDHPRRRVDEQLRHIAVAQPIAVAGDVRHDIGGLAVDGAISRPRQPRRPRLPRFLDRLAIVVHLFVAELAQNTSGKYRFDEEILFEHHGLALRR